MILFMIGFVEMIILSTWTKVVSDSKVIASGLITIFNTLTWFYVLQTVIQDLDNWSLIVCYAAGCALGTMSATACFKWLRDRKRARAKKNSLSTKVEFNY